jgi:hypothetical protein
MSQILMQNEIVKLKKKEFYFCFHLAAGATIHTSLPVAKPVQELADFRC